MNSYTKTKNVTDYLYWSLLVLLAIFFLISGYMEISQHPSTYPKTLRMGYPPYFILTLGIAKILGALALLTPGLKRLKEWALAAFTFDVIFAFISGLAIESYADCIKASIVLGVLMLTHQLFLKRDLPASQPGATKPGICKGGKTTKGFGSLIVYHFVI